LPLLTAGLADDPMRMIILRGAELLDSLATCGFESAMDCCHAIYLSNRPIPYTLPDGAEIRLLDSNHLDFVHEHYRTVDDADYILERIEAGMFGAFVRGEPAGFIGTHDERSMGLLEVLPEYRRLGLAYALEAHLINHLLSLDRTPFCQVSIRNEPSIALQRKLGLALSDTVIRWLIHRQP
jgi:tRNA (guanine37-N1)-methyltransferase